MKRKIRQKIFRETRQIALVLNSRNRRNLRCEICLKDSVFLTPLTIARLLQISTRRVYRLIESGEVHFFEDESKDLLVCLRSLKKTTPGIDNALIKKIRNGE